MKRRFTILTAALALLVFMTPSLVGWGQTRETTTGTLNMSVSQTSPVTVNDVTFTWTSANIVTGGGNSSGFKANSNMTVTIPSGAILTKIEKTNGNNWGSGATISVYAGSDATGTNIASIVTGTHVYNISSNNTGTTYYFANSTGKNAWIKTLSITYEVSSGASTTVSIDATGITNTDVYTSNEAGSLSATVSANGETISGASVAWSSSNTDVATINENGEVTLVAAGTTTITAAYGGESGVYNPSSATYELAVTSSAPYVQPTTVEIIPNYTFWGKTAQFSGDAFDELSGSKDNVSLAWTRGSGSMYANQNAMRFYKDNTLTFTAPEGYEIISIELSVTGTYDDFTFDPTGFDNETTTWTGAAETVTMSRPSNASNYATISKFTITLAAIGNAVATTTTINVPQDFNTDIYQGATAGTLTATVKDNENNTISGATVTWSSSNTGVATIDANGEVTLVAVGTTTITASYAGVEDQYRPSEDTYELTVTDSNAPGTQNNPYTVAQARAAIDAGTGTQGVYATGIVSSIETAWSTQYSNITFNFVDNAGDTDFLQAYRCVSGTGVDASTVVVGDIVVVHGNLTKYGSTYEFGQGCQLVSLEHPTTPFVTVTPSTINAPFAGAEGTLALIYENIEEFTSFDYYFCDADGNELDVDPDWIQAEIQDENDTYSLYYIIGANNGEARTAYIKVYTTIGDELNPEEVYAIVTVNQAKYVVDYATLPFEFNGGKNAIEETNGLTQSGLGSDYADENTKLKFDGTDDYVILKINERPGTLTFNIKNNSFSGGTFKVQTSEDGVTYTDLKTYTEITGTQDEEFTDLGENVRYIKWIYTEKVSGNVGLGNIALAKYVAPPASITVSNDLVEVDAEEHDGTLDLTYESLTITDMTDFGIQFCDANGDELSEEPDWIEVLVAEQDPEIGEGYVVSYYMVENEDTEARTAYFKVFALGDEDYVYSNLVTISQAAYVAPPTPGNWVLTDLADLTAGDVFVIVGNNGNNYALPNNGGTTSPSVVAVTVVENTLSDEVADNLQWNLSVNNSGYVFYPAGSASTWLYCTNSNDGVRVGTGDAKHFSLSENGYLTTTETNNQRYIGIYNSQDWRCYTSEGGNIANQTFAFYKKVSDPITRSKQIAKYEGDGGYVLIASPVCSVAPSADNGFLTSEYDLYAFDQAEADEWRNYKASSFNLVSGKGYLYASSTATTLTFEGQPYNGNGLIALDYDEDANYAGWNLIGNPFDEAATLNVPFYKMNVDGDGLTAKIEDLSNTIATMEGVFVQATADTRTAIFTVPQNNGDAVEPQTVPQVNIMVSRNRGASVVDNAIVRFDGGSMLGKFQLNANSTKLYMLQGDKEMAIVSAQAEGEMPVSFKAAENGTYTLSVNAENVEMSYLHLFDNMTGADVDLLATPSYTFEANTTDYASRFRLVFSANSINEDADGVNAFAYFNGSSWTVSNMGEATLQVVDVMGRVLSSETLSGNAEVSINQTPGVYMLRLVSGDSVKVQKVVVR